MDPGLTMHMWTRAFKLVVLICAMAAVIGCATDVPRNPSFDVSVVNGRTIVRELGAERPRAVRGVVVIGGLYDPLNISTSGLAKRVGGMLDERDGPLSINVFGAATTDELRERVIDRVEAWRASEEPGHTVEVDVVGYSLGAVVARDAAIARPGARRLNVRRIFSIVGPHRGAALAELPDFDQRVWAIRAGSAFIGRINETLWPGEGYELFCYTRLGDSVIGEANAAPPGRSPWWVPTGALERQHGDAYKDPRILADIGLRLAGRDGIGTRPESPLPGN